MSDDSDSVSGYELGTYFVSQGINVIASIFLTFFTLRHLYFMYQDLHTEERASVAHRRIPPERTREYKLVNYCTFGSMFFFMIGNWSFIGSSFAADVETCQRNMSVTLPASAIGKMFIPLVYLFRLHLVYKGSKYEHRLVTLFGCGSFLTVAFLFWAICAVSIGVWNSNWADDYDINDSDTTLEANAFGGHWQLTYDSTNRVYYSICQTAPSDAFVLLYVVLDLVFNLGFTFAFILPIRDVIKRVQGSTRRINDKSKMTKKMIFVGFKVALLSAVLFLSSIIVILIYAIANLILLPTDYVINVICLAFMTAYYPDSQYYQKWCKCCISCCDRKGYTKGKIDQLVGPQSPQNEEMTVTDVASVEAGKSKDATGTDTVGVSADTMSQVRLAANEENPIKSSNDKQETELAAHLSPSNE